MGLFGGLVNSVSKKNKEFSFFACGRVYFYIVYWKSCESETMEGRNQKVQRREEMRKPARVYGRRKQDSLE